MKRTRSGRSKHSGNVKTSSSSRTKKMMEMLNENSNSKESEISDIMTASIFKDINSVNGIDATHLLLEMDPDNQSENNNTNLCNTESTKTLAVLNNVGINNDYQFEKIKLPTTNERDQSLINQNELLVSSVINTFVDDEYEIISKKRPKIDTENFPINEIVSFSSSSVFIDNVNIQNEIISLNRQITDSQNLSTNDNVPLTFSELISLNNSEVSMIHENVPLASSTVIDDGFINSDDSIKDPDFIVSDVTDSTNTSNSQIKSSSKIDSSETNEKRILSYCGDNYEFEKNNINTSSSLQAHGPPQQICSPTETLKDNELPPELTSDFVTLQPLHKLSGIKIYDKIHVCYFCSKPNLKMSRHLSRTHRNEIVVSQLLELPKNSSERRNSFIELTKAGDFYNNIEVLTKKSGRLLVVRRQPSVSDHTQYTPCPECLGFFIKKNLWLHMRKCNKYIERGLTLKRDIQSSSQAFLFNYINKTNSRFNSVILSRISNDDIGIVCKGDHLICQLGILLFEKFGTTQNELVRQEMRRLARLLLQVREFSTEKLASLKDLIKPTKFDIVIKAVKDLCGETVPIDTLNRPEFNVPSLALKLRQSLKKCVYILRAQYLKTNRILMEREVKSFGTLIEMEWANKLSSQACSTLQSRKMNKPDILPLTEDLMKLMEFQSARIKYLSESLKPSKNPQIWKSLAEAVLSRIILFNKRRSGESSKLLLKEYLNAANWESEITGELEQSLSLTEKKLASQMKLIKTRGKRGRTVPVLLTVEMRNAIDLLISKRNDCGIYTGNPFVFARAFTTAISHLRGSDCLREISEMAGLKKPELVRGTKLRKYVATVCQLFDMKEFELEWLANHLGHSVTVHRNFYRLRESAVELAKMSKLLITVENGKVNKYTGKNLDDIRLSDVSDIEENVDNNHENEVNIDEEIVEERNNKNMTNQEIGSNAGVNEEDDNNIHAIGTKIVKRPWTSEEVQAVMSYFGNDIKKSIIPNKLKASKCIDEAPNNCLHTRSWRNVKTYVYNKIKSKK